MKIATLLHGKTGDLYERNVKHSYINNDVVYDDRYGSEYTLEQGSISYKNNLPPAVDFFVHSWSTELKEKILELYNPMRSIIEPQIEFSVTGTKYGELKGSYTRYLHTKSRLYSLLKSIEIYNEYCCEVNTEYDWIVLGRFDLVFSSPLDFSNFKNNSVYISTWFDSGRYIHWTQKIQDFWMITDNTTLQTLFKILSEDIDKLLMKSQTKIGPSAHYLFRDLLLNANANVEQIMYYNSQNIPSSSYSLVRDLSK